MNIDQLECFSAIVKYRTFSEAAEQLNISQSSLSKKIISLENELNVKLFSREKRQVSLTKAGATLYNDAEKICSLSAHMKSSALKFYQETQNTISIVTLPILNQYGLLETLAQFQKKYPELVLNIRELEEPDIKKEHSHENENFIIARQEFLDDISNDFEYKKLMEDDFVLLIPHNHPFAKEERISFQRLATEKFILMNKYTNIYTTFVNLCHQYGFEPNILRTARLETISSSVGLGQGISFMPLKSAELFKSPNTCICHLIEPLTSTIVLARNIHMKLQKSDILFFENFA